MAYASRLGRARINARSPEAAGICQRCGFVYSRADIRYQYDWTGATLSNLRVLVCDRCYDTPQEQSRSIVISADPVPVINPSPEFYALDEAGQDFTNDSDGSTNGDFNSDFGGASVTPYLIGIDPNAQMPLVSGQQWAVLLNVLSILSNGTNLITVNTSTPHGLSTNAQVSVQGLTNPKACAAASITVITANQFTYPVASVIHTASQFNARTRVITLNVGLPYNQTIIPIGAN